MKELVIDLYLAVAIFWAGVFTGLDSPNSTVFTCICGALTWPIGLPWVVWARWKDNKKESK